MQEVEHTDGAEIAQGLGPKYRAFYFKHAKRLPDGVMIALHDAAFECPSTPVELQYREVAFGRVDVVPGRAARG